MRATTVTTEKVAESAKPASEAPGKENIWTCKIGGRMAGRPNGADGPMRRAIGEAYERLTGFEYEFLFSGWGGSITGLERSVVEDRAPSADEWQQETALTDAQIEAGWREQNVTTNPYCTNLKAWTRAVRWTERALKASEST